MKVPPIDLLMPKTTETATFSMGCFWSPDALFGSINGVVRTKVGYTGGTTDAPTYWTLADHIETVQLDYDPKKLSFQTLLHLFFTNHKAARAPWKRQYASAIFYHDQKQKDLAMAAKAAFQTQAGQQIYTEINPLKTFYVAEDRHQKYKLQRQPQIWEEFQEMYPRMDALLHSTAAAKVNAYLYGYGSSEELESSISSFGLSPSAQQVLLQKTRSPKPISCS
ncbi:peptide-methionine (S)-S-oxide reductase MsrA [Pontibacter rugosus]|uniref:peptide-methionine (S)-S-oxide reductase n=1 Tax=Pontibacter rugosus TaxID=1745966 RepID=A0ABW3SLF3_9BACT